VGPPGVVTTRMHAILARSALPPMLASKDRALTLRQAQGTLLGHWAKSVNDKGHRGAQRPRPQGNSAQESPKDCCCKSQVFRGRVAASIMLRAGSGAPASAIFALHNIAKVHLALTGPRVRTG
jgi:hypothetical protein